MAIITLTSDMGLRDHYVAAVKMALLQNARQAYMMDISHEVSDFNISQAYRWNYVRNTGLCMNV